MQKDKKRRRFRTLEELQEEHDVTSHNFKDDLKEVLKNLKNEIFSWQGMLILSFLVYALLSAVVR